MKFKVGKIRHKLQEFHQLKYIFERKPHQNIKIKCNIVLK
ncbi:MAG: hypothetical protein RIS64_4112 [Bacteroidota bacterium]|jgi:hypothetical protein